MPVVAGHLVQKLLKRLKEQKGLEVFKKASSHIGLADRKFSRTKMFYDTRPGMPGELF